jgi:hypothetical protein
MKKIKYENIKKECDAGHAHCPTPKLYDKIIKRPSKSHEAIPLRRRMKREIFKTIFNEEYCK